MFHHTEKAYHTAHPLSAETWRILAVMFFAALAFLYGFGHEKYLLFDVDEGIFTQATVEMIERENYVLPTYNGEPRYHKPPLIYWLQAGSLHLFGAEAYTSKTTEFAVRSVSGVAAWFSVLILYLTLLKLTDRYRFALTAAAIFGLNLSWLLVARAATADAVLNLCILASTGWLLYMLYARQGGFFRQVMAGVLLGLGMLAKGPIALVIPALVIGLAGLMRPQFFQNLRVLNPLVILPVFVLTLAPWVLAVMQATGTDFFKEFILVHNLGRFGGDLGNSHSNSIFYYLIVLLIGFFPWSILLVLAFPQGMSHIIRKLRSTDAYEALQPLALIWFISIVGLFSFSGTKLAHYIVPALPAAAVLIAYWLENLPLQMFRRILIWVGVPVVFVLGGALLALNRLLIAAREGVSDPLVQTLGFAWPPEDPLVQNVLNQVIPLNHAPIIAGGVLIFGSLAGLLFLRHKVRLGVPVLVLTQFAWLSIVLVGVVPTVSDYIQKPLKFAALNLQTMVTAETQVYHYGLHKPSVRLMSQVPFTEVHKAVQLEGKLMSHMLILGEEHRLGEVIEIIPEEIPHKNTCVGGYCVLEVGQIN